MRQVTLCFLLISSILKLEAQHHLMHFIPAQSATHVAQQSGDWFNASTWGNGVPDDGAIVHIPANISVQYEGSSEVHLFALRVDGEFLCKQTVSGQKSKMILETFIGTHSSKIQFHANNSSDGHIEIIFKPFDIEAYKILPEMNWNAMAVNHFSDQNEHYKTDWSFTGKYRYKTYDLAEGNDLVIDSSKVAVDDLAGVLGRSSWDPDQLSIGLTTMGEIEIIGKPKTNMTKLSDDGFKNDLSIEVTSVPSDWQIGDSIIITLGGNINQSSNGNDELEIASISGNTINLSSKLKKNHIGRMADDLHCYVGNMTRNIVFRSAIVDSTHRAHLMVMHNDKNVQIKNASFIDMGRTDKSKILDDKIWSSWKEPVVGNTYVSPLGQECVLLESPDSHLISNHRGRYSIHLHKLGAVSSSKMAQVTGNVIWGNPGWGITHHDSHANVSENIVYKVVGAGIITESGSETGFWDDNLVVDVSKGHTTDAYQASIFHDDYLFSGQALGMKGRAVVCRGNVIADANMGVGIINFNAATSSLDRVDSEALAKTRPRFEIDQFPLSRNGFSKEGDGILPLEVALIMENTTIISTNLGFSSIERDMGVNHESRSIFDKLKIWGSNTGVRITYQNDYSFRDLFISGKNNSSKGLYIWKHAHNHSFERIKLVDLEEGISVSKLVENATTNIQKTRNNGSTPWLFIDLETENVTDLYGIHLEDDSSTTTYDEHSDNPIHITSSQLSLTRPITFTPNEGEDLILNWATNDLSFTIDGVITDRLGAYEFGIEQASTMQNLRNDYPKRIYEFAGQSSLQGFVDSVGIFQDPDDNELYFIHHEYVPDRITYEYKSIPFRVKVLNPPSTGAFGNPQTEPTANFEPKNELISRFATATQSSDASDQFFLGQGINTPASRAIDGNSNGRINAGFYQDGLDSIGSIAATQTELEPWWEMDLGEKKIIEYIDIWSAVELQSRAKETIPSTFNNFYVLVYENPPGDVDLTTARSLALFEYSIDTSLFRVHSLNDLNIEGRYIRIQFEGNTQSRIAEVDVIGRSISPNPDCNGDATGLAYIDECGNCVRGNTVTAPCALDDNYEWKSIILPVELVLFSAKLIQDQSKITWQTQSEEHLSHFELEKSSDAFQWRQLTRQQANNKPSRYKTWDTKPYPGKTYYRIKIFEENGGHSYSQIKVVQRQNQINWKFFPNPSQGNLNVEFQCKIGETYTVEIFDLVGRQHYKKNITPNYTGSFHLQEELESMNAGAYFIDLSNGSIRSSQVFLISE